MKPIVFNVEFDQIQSSNPPDCQIKQVALIITCPAA